MTTERPPGLYARWLSPEGYLGLHLVVGFVLALVTGLVFNVIKDAVMEAPATVRADVWAHDVAQQIQSPWLTDVMRVVTIAGNASTLTVATIAILVVLATQKSRRRLYAFLATMTGGPLLNTLLKTHYQRPRPTAFPHLVDAGGFSFPSGHSMGSMLFFGILAYVVYFTIEKHVRWRIPAVIGCALLVLVVGLSRVYLGVHYLSDVVAGFTGGLFWICVVVSGTEAWVRIRDWRSRRRVNSEQ
jgi:undecaprenyl-diphosphatase